MRGLILFSGFLLSSVLADYVVDLTDSDFDSSVAEYNAALIMFYAPWYVFNLCVMFNTLDDFCFFF